MVLNFHQPKKMNKENAHQYLPLIQSLAEGKTIQVQCTTGQWIDCAEIEYYYSPERYRIKPEPREWSIRRESETLFTTGFCDPDFPIGQAIRVREILD